MGGREIELAIWVWGTKPARTEHAMESLMKGR